MTYASIHILALIILSFASCTNSKKISIIGHYESYQIGKLETIKHVVKNGFKKIYFSAGITLDIKADSTFTYATCGNILTGTWSLEKDSSILHEKTNRFRLDSLNNVLPPPRTGIDKFGIHLNKLYKKGIITVKGKKQKVLDILVKK